MDLERQIDHSASRLAIIAKFIARLGDPRQWEFTGEVVDGGPGSKAECICGHPIRWIFMIQKTGGCDRAQVGSECINHFQEYNPSMCEAMKAAYVRLLEQQKEEKAAFKLAEDQAAQLPVHAKWVEVRQLGRAIYHRAKLHFDAFSNGWLDAPTYDLRYAVLQDKPFKTVKARTKWLERQTGILERAIAEMEKFHPGWVDQARTQPAPEPTPWPAMTIVVPKEPA